MVHGNDEPPWMAVARREIGVREIVGVRHNPRILQYHRATRLSADRDEVPWCASFVCWVLETVGVRSTKSARAASYLDFGRPSEMIPGAIVVFAKSDPDAKGSGHVAFVDRVVDDTVYILGGNQKNRVGIDPRKVSAVVACRWPESP